MSIADKYFISTCKDILENGVWDKGMNVRPKWEDGTPAYTIKKFGVIHRYDLQKEFPLTTIRKTYWKSALDEILWMYQKKSNRVSELSSHIWDQWSDENGTIGKAYGYQLGLKTAYKEGLMDQVDKVLYDLKHNPASRRIITNMYNIQDIPEMALAPCAYSMTFNVTGNKLNGMLNQRSQDMLTAGCGFNEFQYAALLAMMAQVSGFELGEFIHVIADVHIYDRHVPIVQKLIEKEPLDAPTVTIDKSITDFYKFTVESFKVDNYVTHEFKDKIEVAV